MTTPPIGVPRIYEGHQVPVLYPGERLLSRGVPLQDLVRAILAAEACGETEAVLPLSGWLVEPDPSWLGLYRRWRYRLMGQWVARYASWAVRSRVTVDVVSAPEDKG